MSNPKDAVRKVLDAVKADKRASLTVEIDDIEIIKIGNGEFSDAQSGECQEVKTANTAQACDGDTRVAQTSLFVTRDPTDVAGKCLTIIEHEYSSLDR